MKLEAAEHCYDLFGVKISVRSNSVRILAEAALFLAEHEIAPAGEARYHLVFQETQALPETGIPGLRLCRNRECQILEKGHSVFVSAAEGVASLDLRDRCAHGRVLPPANGQRYPKGSVPLVHPLLLRIMHAEGFLPVHAAGVVLGDELLLLTGDKGSGKSTLACRFHRQGFPLVCDDLLYLKRREGRLYGGGHCQPVKIRTSETGALPPDCIPVLGVAGVRGKTLFSPRHLNPNGFNRLHPIQAVVFLDKPRKRGRSAVLPDHAVAVLHHLLGDSPLANTAGYHARALDWFCAAGSPPLYFAQPGDDADETARAILHALNQPWPGC
jgi:hypothetical protein